MSDLLRICTAGSVDDGKSTLIGRLLYDARGVYEDQLLAVERASRHRGAGPIDFSLFTDGLKAEREQGITIDVAYRYFATANRKFILADTPGHEQYTRNMATGASTAEVAILLVDARHGVRPQSRRHARITRLLGISELVVAVNKMDLVDFDRGVFDHVVADFSSSLDGARVHAVPISALLGDNVTERSERTPWYDGPGLLRYLESVKPSESAAGAQFRYPVQLVIRPNDEFRGYAGRILSGSIRVGDAITAYPSGSSTHVERIVTGNGDLDAAASGDSIVLTLADEIDVSRGDVLASGAPYVGNRFDADLVWMDERPLKPGRVYRLKHTTRVVGAEVDTPAELNDIVSLSVTTTKPLVFDSYRDVRAAGCFVLIDPETNFTAGAGMIRGPLTGEPGVSAWQATAEQLTMLVREAASDDAAVARLRAALEALLR